VASLLTAEEAARRLGVSRQTLYAYVSRGLVGTHAADDPRQRRYMAEEIERLGRSRKRGRRPKEVAKAALDWGTPVLESAIATVDKGRLYYRGRDAVAVARSASLEETAALLWRTSEPIAFSPRAPVFATEPPSRRQDGFADALLTRFVLATDDEATAVWQADERIIEGCGALLRVMAALLADRSVPCAAPIHLQIADALSLDGRAAERLRMALVLCADHEFNASSFAARVVASTEASLRAAAIAGLAALTGPRHGGMTWRVESLFDGVGVGDPTPGLRQRLAAGEDLPGFGHPLYPKGDVRAAAILSEILPELSRGRAIAEAVEELTGRRPSLDFALVALRRALNLPQGFAFGLFALGRTVGWIAHALEQRERRSLIRPRAVYVGPPPGLV
jgi:citrate synthase